MGHNFVLLKKKVNLIEFANKAATARDNQYIPVGSDEVIVYTDMIGGGQETTIEFLPPEPGVYDFVCSFPGHYAMMKGKFIVE
jgi:azurin